MLIFRAMVSQLCLRLSVACAWKLSVAVGYKRGLLEHKLMDALRHMGLFHSYALWVRGRQQAVFCGRLRVLGESFGRLSQRPRVIFRLML